MGNLIYVQLFWGFSSFGIRCLLSLKDEDVSDSLLRVLMRKIHEQDEKIVAIEENAKLDHRHLVSKILRLEDKLTDSNFKQLILEKTVRNMDKNIKELNSKLRTKTEDYLNNEHSLGKQEQENPFSEPPATVFQNTTDVGEDRSVVASSKQRRILNVGVHPTNVIAFHAYLGKSENSPSLHHTLIYDTVTTNVGGSYNRHDGVFTAPVSGVYVFNWSTYSGFNSDIYTVLMVNSDQWRGTRSDSLNVREDHTSSGCAVVEITQGDIVFIRTHPTRSSTGLIISSPGLHHLADGFCTNNKCSFSH